MTVLFAGQAANAQSVAPAQEQGRIPQVESKPVPISPAAPTTVAPLSPAMDPNARREALVGRWYGETTTPEGQALRWLIERDSNGTYRTQYLWQKSKEESEESIEIGQWGLSGPIVFTIQRAWIKQGETQRADPSNAYTYDAYELSSLNDRLMEYKSMSSGKRFRARRVGNDFQLKN